jgi:dolichol-phosphate mannosyltransferase
MVPIGQSTLHRAIWPDSARWGRAVWAVFAVTLLLRLIAMATVPLIPEEAYYWMYAQHLQPGYFDHPPMVAWTIRAGVELFGNSELGVRFFGHLAAWGASVLLYLYARQWYPRRVALAAALLIQILPLYFGIGLIATMDAPLLLFWSAALLGVSLAIQRENPWGWYLAGAATGLAFLSKYTALFLPIGIVVAVFGRGAWRWHLRTIHPYLGGALALVVASPVIVWNAQHQWASFRFQFVERYAHDTFNAQSVLVFWQMQLATLTPVLLVALLVLLYRYGRHAKRRLRGGDWLALSFFAPVTAVVLFKSLKSEVHVNWMAPVYLSILPLMAHAGLARLRLERQRARRWGWGTAVRATVVGCLAINTGLLLYLVVLEPVLHAWPAFGPWTGIAQVVEEYEEKLEEANDGREPLIIADGTYRLASVIAFYRRQFEKHPDGMEESYLFTTSQWVLRGEGLGYEYWLRRDECVGMDAIYISKVTSNINKVKPWFDTIEVVEDPRLPADGRYRIIVCRRLRGEPKISDAPASPPVALP